MEIYQWEIQEHLVEVSVVAVVVGLQSVYQRHLGNASRILPARHPPLLPSRRSSTTSSRNKDGVLQSEEGISYYARRSQLSGWHH